VSVLPISIKTLTEDPKFRTSPGAPEAKTRIGNEPAKNAAVTDPDLQEIASAPFLHQRDLSNKPMEPDRISASLTEKDGSTNALSTTSFERQTLDHSIASVPQNNAEHPTDEMFANEMISNDHNNLIKRTQQEASQASVDAENHKEAMQEVLPLNSTQYATAG